MIPRVVEREADVADALRDTATCWRVRAGGSWMDAGRGVAADGVLDVGRLRGIVAYEPGDLTLTAWAGTTLSEIHAATAPHGQWLPLDAPAAEVATLGATLATASCGPLAATVGHPRDLALGITLVDGRGHLVHAGGRVVKNVAGFDLVRLTVGAWGTLGVITQATVRLRPRPAVDRTLLVAADDAAEAVSRLRQLPPTALAIVLVNVALADRLGLGAAAAGLVRLGGSARSVAAAVACLGPGAREIDAGVWDALKRAGCEESLALRVSSRPSALHSLWGAVAERRDVWATACAGRGVVHCSARTTDAVDDLLARWQDAPSRIGERLHEAGWNQVPAAAMQHRLARGMRDVFDPDRRLNPGVLGGGRS